MYGMAAHSGCRYVLQRLIYCALNLKSPEFGYSATVRR